MSLKAKVEAVVYAAEEPVTLAQLAAVLHSEMLESMAAAAAQEQQARDEQSAELFAAGEGAEEFVPPESIETAEAPEPAATANAGNPTANPEAARTAESRAARLRDRQVREALRRILDELIAEYASVDRGVEIREIAGGYRMATKPEYHDAVRGFVKTLKPPMKLSLQALETLAVIAYKQPVTAPEVSEIRGVDSGGVLGSLISRKLITTAGRKQVIGRPILYKTTKEFLLRFGLSDLSELPSIEEFEKMAGELAEADGEPTPADDAMNSGDLAFASEEAATAQAKLDAAAAGVPSNGAESPQAEEDAALESTGQASQ